MTDWIVLESWARELFKEANQYRVKAKNIKEADIKRFAKEFNLNLKNFKVAINNEKYKWTDDLPLNHY